MVGEEAFKLSALDQAALADLHRLDLVLSEQEVECGTAHADRTGGVCYGQGQHAVVRAV